MEEHKLKKLWLEELLKSGKGVEFVHQKHPEVDIYCGALDDHLNEDLYIVPGIGDGGDRIFGTK